MTEFRSRERSVEEAKGRKPPGRYVGSNADEALAALQVELDAGRYAWLEDDFGLDMSGRAEWMGYTLHVVPEPV